MVVPTGRYIFCHHCGKRFAEGDCRDWYCSYICREIAEKENAEIEKKIKDEINKCRNEGN